MTNSVTTPTLNVISTMLLYFIHFIHSLELMPLWSVEASDSFHFLLSNATWTASSSVQLTSLLLKSALSFLEDCAVLLVLRNIALHLCDSFGYEDCCVKTNLLTY